MGGLAEQWEGWEVQILLLSSLLLQVLLLVFSEWRRRVSHWALLSAALNGILWLLYQLADTVAIYVLGHMSLSSKPREQQQLTAFWASLLLVHLGGQDTITAYAMEDNDLWLRHLLTLVVQAAGAAYVLYKYITGGALLAASVLMFVVGVIKYGERIYALKSSGLDSIRKFLDGFEVLNPDKLYPVPACSDDPEEVLQGAHDLLHVCMGQFVDYKVWPSRFQTAAILVYHDRINPDGTTAGRSMLTQLVGMQLSLMRDILYTKALVLGAWYGCLSRVVSMAATIVAFHLFQASTMGAGSGYSRRDMVVTYILLCGAFVLEVVSLLRTAMSTWTCAWLRDSGWNRLHAAVVSLRRGVKSAQRCRKWSGSIRQHDIFQLSEYSRQSVWYFCMSCFGLEQWWSRLRFFDSVVISHDVDDLVLGEIQRMVEAYGQNDLKGPGQVVLGAWGKAGAGAGLYDGVVGVEEGGFDGSILAWHYATDAFLRAHKLCDGSGTSTIMVTEGEDMDDGLVTPRREEMRQQEGLAKAICTLSRYMMFLLVERPHLLPSPVRRSQYDSFCAKLMLKQQQSSDDDLQPEVRLANNMLRMCEDEGIEEVLRVVSRAWVEMLCYAASHCSHDSHGRQLSSSTELVTLVWILTTALYSRFQHEDQQFMMVARHFWERHERRRERNKRIKEILWSVSSIMWAVVSGDPTAMITKGIGFAVDKISLDRIPP